MQVQKLIEETLSSSFTITYLDVANESHMHSVPANSETHFKVVLASPDFNDVRKVRRHQQVYKALDEAMKKGVHALALHIYTEDEWRDKTGEAPVSPNCMGGSKGADSKGDDSKGEKQ
jgi:BolA family transcriptional regulator, general stress-responsive regulator